MYLSSYSASLFEGLQVNQAYPLAESYLRRAHAVYLNAFSRHPRILMFHVVLRFPVDYKGARKGVISSCTRSFKERLKRSLKRRAEEVRVHDSDVNFVWCREFNKEHREHYHVMVLVNGQTYRYLGNYSEQNKDHLAGMMNLAWASALNVKIDEVRGLVHFAGDAMSVSAKGIVCEADIQTDYGTFSNMFEAGFFWLSYLCKMDTKEFTGDGRNFGTSQITGSNE